MPTKSLIKRLLRIDKIAIDNVNFEMDNDEEMLVIKARPIPSQQVTSNENNNDCKEYSIV